MNEKGGDLMGKKKICGCCKTEYKDSRKQKIQRNIVRGLLISVKVALPGIEETLKGSKDFCFKCFHKAIIQAIGPSYKAYLGIFAEEEEPQAEDQDSSEPGKNLKAD